MRNAGSRTASSLSVGAAAGLIPHLLGGSWLTMVIVVVAVAMVAVVTKQVLLPLLTLPIASAAAVLCVVILQRILGSVELDASFLVLALLLTSLILLACAPRPREVGNGFALVVAIPLTTVVCLLAVLNRTARSWTAEKAFGILASNGEDNAAWLIALSRSVKSGQTVLTDGSGLSGGPATGLFVASWRELMAWISQSDMSANAENGLVLVRMYPLLATLCSLLAVTIVLAHLMSSTVITRTLTSLVAAVVTYASVMGFATVGHFSAAVAVFFLIVAVAASEIVPTLSRHRVASIVTDAAVAVSLLAAGQAWFPLTFLAVLYAFMRLSGKTRRVLSESTNRRLKISALVGSAVAVLLLLFGGRLLFPSFFSNFTDLGYLTKNLSLAGGYSTMSPWVIVLTMTVPLLTMTELVRRHTQSLIAVLTLPPVALFIWAYFLPPFTPQYGAWKYLYVATASLLPLMIVFIVRVAHQFGGRRVSLASVGTVSVFFSVFSPPLSYVGWASSVGASRYEWVDPIVHELRKNPATPVGCLNTIKDDQGQNYVAYLCSRMAFGLGGFDDIHHRVWTAANLCAAPPEQVASEWTVERQQNFTVILFDGARQSSNAGCQVGEKPFENGWLTAINLNNTRTLDIRGNPVRPSD